MLSLILHVVLGNVVTTCFACQSTAAFKVSVAVLILRLIRWGDLIPRHEGLRLDLTISTCTEIDSSIAIDIFLHFECGPSLSFNVH